VRVDVFIMRYNVSGVPAAAEFKAVLYRPVDSKLENFRQNYNWTRSRGYSVLWAVFF